MKQEKPEMDYFERKKIMCCKGKLRKRYFLEKIWFFLFKFQNILRIKFYVLPKTHCTGFKLVTKLKVDLNWCLDWFRATLEHDIPPISGPTSKKNTFCLCFFPYLSKIEEGTSWNPNSSESQPLILQRYFLGLKPKQQ